jgi:hypothetical protein
VKSQISALVISLIVLLIFASGCTGDILTKAGVGNFGNPLAQDSSFTCDYDENHLKTSPEFSAWFNTSCYYNEHCGWFESIELRVEPKQIECINCTSFQYEPTPVPTPCPVRTIKTSGLAGRKSVSTTSTSVLADEENRQVSLAIDCTMKKEEILTKESDTRIVKIKGDVPFTMAKNWDKTPLIDGLQVYGSAQSGGATKLDLYSELNHACTSENCVPCHFIYKGPVWIGATVMHDPKNTPSDWQVIVLPAGETINDLGSGTLVQYTKNLETSCPLSSEQATTILVTSAYGCFAGGEKTHAALNEGSEITFATQDPNVKLDSKAVFHVLK